DWDGSTSIRITQWRDDSPCRHRHLARPWHETLRSGPHLTCRTSPEWLISGVTAAGATEATRRGLGGMSGESLLAIKHLTRDALLPKERHERWVCLPTAGVER